VVLKQGIWASTSSTSSSSNAQAPKRQSSGPQRFVFSKHKAPGPVSGLRGQADFLRALKVRGGGDGHRLVQRVWLTETGWLSSKGDMLRPALVHQERGAHLSRDACLWGRMCAVAARFPRPRAGGGTVGDAQAPRGAHPAAQVAFCTPHGPPQIKQTIFLGGGGGVS
jgi:hypothetical protein